MQREEGKMAFSFKVFCFDNQSTKTFGEILGSWEFGENNENWKRLKNVCISCFDRAPLIVENFWAFLRFLLCNCFSQVDFFLQKGPFLKTTENCGENYFLRILRFDRAPPFFDNFACNYFSQMVVFCRKDHFTISKKNMFKIFKQNNLFKLSCFDRAPTFLFFRFFSPMFFFANGLLSAERTIFENLGGNCKLRNLRTFLRCFSKIALDASKTVFWIFIFHLEVLFWIFEVCRAGGEHKSLSLSLSVSLSFPPLSFPPFIPSLISLRCCFAPPSVWNLQGQF